MKTPNRSGVARHERSTPRRNSNRIRLTSSGRSCCTQCPAPSIHFSVYGPAATSRARSGGDRRTDRVGRAADEQRRHGDRRVGELRGRFPVAVVVAVPVQRPGESGPAELGRVVVELVGADPVRQRRGPGGQPGEHSRAWWRPRRRPSRRRPRPAPGSAACRSPSPKLRNATVRWVGTCGLGIGGTLRPATAATRSGCNSAAFHTTIGAPVVSDEHRAGGTDVVEQADEVAGQRVDVVVVTASGHD